MKKKLTAFLVSAVLGLSILISACGPKAISAEDYVTGIYKLLINMDAEGAKSIGISDADVKKYKESMEKSVSDTMNSMNESFKQQFGITVDDTLMKECAQEYLNALKKLSAKTSVESNTDKEYKVKVTTTYLDMPTLMSDAMTGAEGKVKASDYETADEYYKALIPEYIKALKDGLASYTPPADEASATVTLNKDGNKWNADLAELTKAIAGAAVKMNN